MLFRSQINSDDPSAIVAAYQSALRSTRTAHLQQEQLPRIAIVILAWAAIMLILLRNKTARWMLAGGMIYLLLFNGTYAVINGGVFSFSSLSSPAGFILNAMLIAAPCFTVGALLVFIKNKVDTRQPLQAALHIVQYDLSILAWLSLPVMLHYAINWIGPAWYMPDPTVSFLGLFSLLQTLAACVMGLLFSGLAGLMLRFRPKDS